MELPIDILASIYLYLQKDEDRLNFRKTCTAAYHFQQTVNEPHTLEQIKNIKNVYLQICKLLTMKIFYIFHPA